MGMLQLQQPGREDVITDSKTQPRLKPLQKPPKSSQWEQNHLPLHQTLCGSINPTTHLQVAIPQS